MTYQRGGDDVDVFTDPDAEDLVKDLIESAVEDILQVSHIVRFLIVL